MPTAVPGSSWSYFCCIDDRARFQIDHQIDNHHHHRRGGGWSICSLWLWWLLVTTCVWCSIGLPQSAQARPNGFHNNEPPRMLVKLLNKESQAWNYIYAFAAPDATVEPSTTSSSSSPQQQQQPQQQPEPCPADGGESCSKYCRRVWKSSVHYCRYCSLAKREVCRCF